MTAVLDQSTSPGSRGSHYNKGAEYLYYVSQSPPQIWRQPVHPVTQIAQQAAKSLLSGQLQNLNSLSSADLRWVGGTTNQVQALNGSKIAALPGFTALDQISPEALEAVDWDLFLPNNALGPENGQSAVGNFYAVRIPVSGGDPHYAKVRIFKDNATRIEWSSYIVGTRPSVLHTLGTEYAEPRDLFVNELETEIYVSGGTGELSYVIKLQRILAGPFPQYSNSPIQINDPYGSIQVLDPQQMVVDGDTIYVAAADGMFLLQYDFGVQLQVVNGIPTPVGLLLDREKEALKAYISGSDGEVYVVDISQFNGPTFDASGNQTGISSAPILAPAPTETLSLGGPSGFLTWADDAHTAFYGTVVNATGQIKRVDLVATEATSELTSADPTVPAPWSVQVFAEGSLTAICDAAIYDIERGVQVTADLALGIGLIPFGFINNSALNPPDPVPFDGRANTSSAPGYYFSAHPNLAFGGSLSLLINHEGAWNTGLRFYKLTLSNELTGQSRAITNAFVDLLWNSMVEPPRFEPRTTAVQNSAFFPVRQPSEFWYNPYLGAIVHTSVADNGYNRLKIDFFDVNKLPVPSASFTRLLYVDNNRSRVSISGLRRGSNGNPPDPLVYQLPDTCGLIPYGSKQDLLEFDFTAYHPSGVGKYSVSFSRGNKTLFTASGGLTESAELITIADRTPTAKLKVEDLTGTCDIANITVRVSAPAPGVINGHGWVNLGASTYTSFTLAPQAAQPLVPLRASRESAPAIAMKPPAAKK